MYYTIYKTTNLINGKYYIGLHKTKDLYDGYLGSGKALLNAIEKYGRENFSKEYLFVFDNVDDMIHKEKELVTEELCKDPKTYNIKLGGLGSFDYINKNNLRPVHSSDFYINYKHSFKKGAYISNKKVSEGIYPARFLGKRHTDESKRKIGEKNSIHQKGKGNSQYGTTRTFDTKNKIRETLANKPNLKCPHCSKESNNIGVMNRWHFDNCKFKMIKQ